METRKSESPVIPYGHQDINEDDIAAVTRVLRSDWLTQGPAIAEFERVVAGYCGVKHAVAVCNATGALHIACLAAGLGPGDELWTSPNTFVASANCGLYAGATVDFVDIEPRTYNLDPAQLEAKLAKAERAPKVVVPVHFSGQSCDMRAIGKLKSKHGFTVIEDASHAIGAEYGGKPVGSCEFSDMTVLSFHPVKIVTTGEGGMVLTNSDALHAKLLRLRTHGISRNPAELPGEFDGPWYYGQIDLGYNYRITDLQAALGTNQMKRLEEFVRVRRDIARRYDEALRDLPLVLPWQSAEGKSAYHLYVVKLDTSRTQKSRRAVFEALRAAGIGVNVHYIPVHRQPYYARLGFKPGMFPEAERYYAQALSLPMFPGLSEKDQKRVVEALRAALA